MELQWKLKLSVLDEPMSLTRCSLLLADFFDSLISASRCPRVEGGAAVEWSSCYSNSASKGQKVCNVLNMYSTEENIVQKEKVCTFLLIL